MRLRLHAAAGREPRTNGAERRHSQRRQQAPPPAQPELVPSPEPNRPSPADRAGAQAAADSAADAAGHGDGIGALASAVRADCRDVPAARPIGRSCRRAGRPGRTLAAGGSRSLGGSAGKGSPSRLGVRPGLGISGLHSRCYRAPSANPNPLGLTHCAAITGDCTRDPFPRPLGRGDKPCSSTKSPTALPIFASKPACATRSSQAVGLQPGRRQPGRSGTSSTSACSTPDGELVGRIVACSLPAGGTSLSLAQGRGLPQTHHALRSSDSLPRARRGSAQMAVARHFQGRGHGRRIIEEVERCLLPGVHAYSSFMSDKSPLFRFIENSADRVAAEKSSRSPSRTADGEDAGFRRK